LSKLEQFEVDELVQGLTWQYFT